MNNNFIKSLLTRLREHYLLRDEKSLDNEHVLLLESGGTLNSANSPL